MHKETRELYFADDGTPFEECKEACEVYDALYHKCYNMIEYGKVLFWNYKGELIRSQLLSYTWNKDDKLCYYDWLKKQLNNIKYFRINTDRTSTEFDDVWDLLRGLLDLYNSRERTLYNNYETGDVCVLDEHTCRYVNQDDIVRSFAKIKKKLDVALSVDFKMFTEDLCVYASE